MTQARAFNRPAGWLKPANNRGAILIEFQLQGKRYKFAPILKGQFDNISDYRQAGLVCEQIEMDIRRGNFDTSLEKYKPSIADESSNPSTAIALLEIWELYKKGKKDSVELTTQKHTWTFIDRVIQECRLADCTDFIALKESILRQYALDSTLTVLVGLSASINYAIFKGKDLKNPLKQDIVDLKRAIERKQKANSTTSRKAFNKAERDAIINAFETDRFNPPESEYQQSYYANLVKFRFYTGTRPEEAIALTWEDIHKNKILITKAYSNGILKATKNRENRQLPINSVLLEILEDQRHQVAKLPRNPKNLVFPSVTGVYISQSNFNRRAWTQVVKGLVESGEVSRYLPSANQRHTFATMALEANVPPHIVANWMGHSVEVLMKKYASVESQIQIPSLE